MKVTAIYVSGFSHITPLRRETVSLDGDTLADLIEALQERHGRKFRDAIVEPHTGGILPGMAVLVSGRRLDPTAKLSNGDEVVFVMAIAGG
jgi:molybdopterin converting factor small subunit